MKIFFKITPLIIVVITILIYKWTLFYKFDPVYFKDYYEHSQWNIALSPRIMGDGGLYQYSGYKLALGDSPYNINPEAPPLGKYLYGVSTIIFGNSYLPTIPLYILTTIFFYNITGFYFNNKKSRLISLIFLLINPLYFFQISQTMLDLPQLCFFLGHLLFLFKLTLKKEKKSFGYLFLTGLFLGAFNATKIGLLIPFIILTDAILLFKSKKLIYLPFIIIISGFVYLLSYTKYFIDGNSIFNWIAGQKYILNFYRNSHVSPIPGMIFLSIFLGIFKGWWGGGCERVKEWNINMAIGVFALYYKTRELFSGKLNPHYSYLVIFCLGIVIFYFFIPFWYRYLILALPFLIILTVKFLEDKKSIYRKLLTIILLLQSLIFISFQPKEDMNQVIALWEKGLYQDLYDYQMPNMSRQDFYISNLTFDKQVDVKGKIIKFEVPYVFPWQSKATARFSIKYVTKVGELTREVPVQIIKENNKWKISDWSNLFFGYSPGDKLVVAPIPVYDGIFMSKDGLILSKTGEREFISVVPNLIQGEEIFKDLEKLTGQDNLDLRAKTYVLYPGDWQVPIGFPVPNYDTILFEKISKDPSVILENKQTRIYNPILLENDFYQQIKEAESKNPELSAKQGGIIQIIKPEKNIKIFDSKGENGKDVILETLSNDIFPDLSQQLENIKSQGKYTDWYHIQ